MVPLNASKFDGGRPERVLDIVTKNETLVYWYDQENKKQSLVRLLPGESPPMKCLRSRSTSKHIIADSAKFGDMISHLLHERKTANAEWNINICLPTVFEAWTARHPNNDAHGLLLHHDNASAHTAAATLDYLQANRIQLVTKTTFSPGLSPL